MSQDNAYYQFYKNAPVAEGGSDCDFGGDGNGDASDAGGDLVSQFFATVCATSSDQAAPS